MMTSTKWGFVRCSSLLGACLSTKYGLHTHIDHTSALSVAPRNETSSISEVNFTGLLDSHSVARLASDYLRWNSACSPWAWSH